MPGTPQSSASGILAAPAPAPKAPPAVLAVATMPQQPPQPANDPIAVQRRERSLPGCWMLNLFEGV
eukprot:2362862-Alexandrium_andersonii.AAC.1